MLVWLVRMLTTSHGEYDQYATSLGSSQGRSSACTSPSRLRAAMGTQTGSAVEMAQSEVQAANLVLVLLFALAVAAVSLLSSLIGA